MPILTIGIRVGIGFVVIEGSYCALPRNSRRMQSEHARNTRPRACLAIGQAIPCLEQVVDDVGLVSRSISRARAVGSSAQSRISLGAGSENARARDCTQVVCFNMRGLGSFCVI